MYQEVPGGVGCFEQLTRRHAVEIASTASVEQCSLPVGEIVGYDNIVSATCMNNAIVLFYGKLVSPIKMIPMSSKPLLLKHAKHGTMICQVR